MDSHNLKEERKKNQIAHSLHVRVPIVDVLNVIFFLCVKILLFSLNILSINFSKKKFKVYDVSLMYLYQWWRDTSNCYRSR